MDVMVQKILRMLFNTKSFFLNNITATNMAVENGINVNKYIITVYNSKCFMRQYSFNLRKTR